MDEEAIWGGDMATFKNSDVYPCGVIDVKALR